MNLLNLCVQAGWDTTKNAARASAVGLTNLRQQDDQMLADANGQKATHKVTITLGLVGLDLVVTQADCSCQDFRTRGKASQTLCKHLIGTGQNVDTTSVDIGLVGLGMQTRAAASGGTPTVLSAPPTNPAPASPAVQTPSNANTQAEPTEFRAKVAHRVSNAIQGMAQQVLDILADKRTPYLHGPSGCGKTSAGEVAALMSNWKIFELFGTESWTDAEMVGIDMAGMRKPGILTRAAHAVREEGVTALVIITEVPRFNPKAINVLINPLLSKSVEVARSMGIQTDVPIRHFEGPFWGSEWAPAEQLLFCLDGNPWGNPLDPAIRQRIVPIEADFADAVANCFDEPIRSAVLASWEWVRSGKADVVIDYRELTAARGPDDLDIVRNYLARLRMKDKAAAASFLKLQPALQQRLAGAKP